MRAKNRTQAQKSEERVEQRTGLKRSPGSGCGKIFKGDNGNEKWHYEDKSTRQNPVKIDRRWWEKAQYQATKSGKVYTALGISPVGENRVVLIGEDLLQDAAKHYGWACRYIITIDSITRQFDKEKLHIRSVMYPYNEEELCYWRLLFASTKDHKGLDLCVLTEHQFKKVIEYYD